MCVKSQKTKKKELDKELETGRTISGKDEEKKKEKEYTNNARYHDEVILNETFRRCS